MKLPKYVPLNVESAGIKLIFLCALCVTLGCIPVYNYFIPHYKKDRIVLRNTITDLTHIIDRQNKDIIRVTGRLTQVYSWLYATTLPKGYPILQEKKTAE